MWIGEKHNNAPPECTNILHQIQKGRKLSQSTDRTNKQRKSGKGNNCRRKKMNMRMSVTSEHCFECEETQETTRRKKNAKVAPLHHLGQKKKLQERQDIPKTTTTTTKEIQ